MEPVIQVKNLSKKFSNVLAVKNISFSVHSGEVFGIIGPNGAGKTTTIEIIEGLQVQTRGSVQVLGLDPKKNVSKIREQIGVMFQHTELQRKIKVWEAVDLFSNFYSHNISVEDALHRLNLEPYRNHYFSQLSGGWKQKVLLTLATLHAPKILFLDEPSAGLDPNSRRDLWHLILLLRDQGTTIILTTHYMEEAERLCDRIALINHGKLVGLDTPESLIAHLTKEKSLIIQGESIDLTELKALPSVMKAVPSKEMIRLTVTDFQKASFEVFSLATRLNWKIDDFRYDRGTLDDLFAQLSTEKEGML
ncbi:ABC transporter ATP-binding protein [Sporolactobacillus shoreae]|uniref:ABC transporter ATP-binding protein n=1 Tax=Sporolactobacillus shoreae TaxID=1465501 RepID=A0A4Z0GRC3_9BACL|nr:ABC transporter ATP-binding protein [Sporolactobacillus shoreae]TGA99158.1 ABC transporter ATP-binding protein [Sporolactobacillus shoreae]